MLLFDRFMLNKQMIIDQCHNNDDDDDGHDHDGGGGDDDDRGGDDDDDDGGDDDEPEQPFGEWERVNGKTKTSLHTWVICCY